MLGMDNIIGMDPGLYNKIMSVPVPPPIVDFFGNNVIGSMSYGASPDDLVGSGFDAPRDGTILGVRFYGSKVGGGNMRAVICDVLGNIVSQSIVDTFVDAADQYNILPVPNVPMTTGTHYIAMVWSEAPGQHIIYIEGASPDNLYLQNGTPGYPVAPDPLVLGLPAGFVATIEIMYQY